jgi:hypothetical protein
VQLADLRLAVRPRNTYEAIDLGVRLVQTEAGLLWRTWFMVALPVLLLAIGGTLLGASWMSLLLWWLKPVYDQALLIVLSRRVFGDTPTAGDVLRTLAGSWRGLFAHLGWRRFSMSRSYLMPVWLLENLPARERAPRIAVLRKQHTGRARALFIVMLHFEMIVNLTMISLLFWFAPQSHTLSLWQDLTQGHASISTTLVYLLAYFTAISVIEPFYVATGFTLYLNRRTELEAWDLELSFRHLRERLDAQRRGP